MSRFAHHHPEDPQGAWDALVDRADHQRKQARENDWNIRLSEEEMRQSGEPAFDLEWARKVMANPISRSDHVILAQSQATVAVQMMAGDDPQIGIAITLLKEAIDHAHTALDPRDPDPTCEGIFQDHNCSRCVNGKFPCAQGNPRKCDWPRARND